MLVKPSFFVVMPLTFVFRFDGSVVDCEKWKQTKKPRTTKVCIYILAEKEKDKNTDITVPLHFIFGWGYGDRVSSVGGLGVRAKPISTIWSKIGQGLYSPHTSVQR